jgi:hypothetical protein
LNCQLKTSIFPSGVLATMQLQLSCRTWCFANPLSWKSFASWAQLGKCVSPLSKMELFLCIDLLAFQMQGIWREGWAKIERLLWEQFEKNGLVLDLLGCLVRLGESIFVRVVMMSRSLTLSGPTATAMDASCGVKALVTPPMQQAKDL